MRDSIERLEARAGLYAALALGLDYPGDHDDWDVLVASLRSLSERLEGTADWETAIGNLAHAIVESRAFAISPAEEHTFLFARQAPCPPRESAFMDAGRSHVLADVAAFYRAFGFYVAPTMPQVPDHLCSQLEFMAVLCAKEAYALQHGLTEPAEICRDARRTFLEEHLGRWADPFIERVHGTARLPLYPALVELVRTLLTYEAHLLEILLSGRSPVPPQPIADEESEFQCAV